MLPELPTNPTETLEESQARIAQLEDDLAQKADAIMEEMPSWIFRSLSVLNEITARQLNILQTPDYGVEE